MKNNFIQKAKEKFPNFDYSKTSYTNSKTKVVITCPEHGDFEILPTNFLKSHFGCPSCGRVHRTKNLRKKDFVKEALEKFPRFDYSKVKYINEKTNVVIICPEHGEFETTPASFLLSKHGCPMCAIEHRSKLRSMSFSEFVEKANKVHKNKYKYHKDTYINTRQKTLISCPLHGDFWQLATNHLAGDDCPICAKENRIKLESLTTEQFILKARKIHKDKYDYSKVKYINNRTPVEIICPKHGSFWQRPDAHLQGKECQLCKNSKGEKQVMAYLENKNLAFQYQYHIKLDTIARKTNTVILDFYLEWNNNKYAIEFHGIQHYEWTPIFQTKEEFQLQLRRDEEVRKYCKTNNIQLIEIKYDTDVIESLDLYFKNVAELKNLK